jgi:hypothetical protein
MDTKTTQEDLQCSEILALQLPLPPPPPPPPKDPSTPPRDAKRKAEDTETPDVQIMEGPPNPKRIHVAEAKADQAPTPVVPRPEQKVQLARKIIQAELELPVGWPETSSGRSVMNVSTIHGMGRLSYNYGPNATVLRPAKSYAAQRMWLDDTGLVRAMLARKGIQMDDAATLMSDHSEVYCLANLLAFHPIRGRAVVTYNGAMLAMAFANYWVNVIAFEQSAREAHLSADRRQHVQSLQRLEQRWSKHVSEIHPDLIEDDLVLRRCAERVARDACVQYINPSPTGLRKRKWAIIMVNALPFLRLMADGSLCFWEPTEPADRTVSGVVEVFRPFRVPVEGGPIITASTQSPPAIAAATPAAAAQ